MGAGFGHECALNKRQQGNFGRHVALFHFGENVVKIGAAALHSAVEIGAAGAVVGFVAAHDFRVDFAHAEVLPHTSPQIVVVGGGIAQNSSVEVGDGGGNLLRRISLGEGRSRNSQA